MFSLIVFHILFTLKNNLSNIYFTNDCAIIKALASYAFISTIIISLKKFFENLILIVQWEKVLFCGNNFFRHQSFVNDRVSRRI